jgi:phage tail tape-measure protein
MGISNPSTIVAVFEDRGHAEMAIDELLHQGFSRDQVGIVMPHGEVKEAQTPTERSEERAAKGAVAGAVSGGAAGAVAGALATALIPGVGAVLAGGLLTGILLGSAAGAAGGSYVGPFVALGFSKEEETEYEQHLKAGRTVVVVRPEDHVNDAVQILREHGGRLRACETLEHVPAR